MLRQSSAGSIAGYREQCHNLGNMASWSAVTVLKKSYRFPTQCPDCLGLGPLTNVVITADLRIEAPFCEPCAARQLRWRKLGRPITILAAVIAFAVMFWFGLSKWVGCWLAVAFVLPGVWLTEYQGRVVRLKSYDADKMTLEFKRGEYAQQFAQLNNADYASWGQ